jgi:hypothetical protein
MPNLTEMHEARQTAGEAYAAAAAAYVAAYIELHAHDLALMQGVASGFADFGPPTAHAEFLRSPLHANHGERASKRREALGYPSTPAQSEGA